MDKDYKEELLREERLTPWKVKSLPKFTDVPERKFNSCRNAKNDDDPDPSAPPPSPKGAFKYPELLRGCNSWPRTTSVNAIIAELCKNGDHKTITNPTSKVRRYTDTKRGFKITQPKSLQNFLIDIKPANGVTKMYLWPQSNVSVNCPKDSTRSASKMENVAKVSRNCMQEKSKSFLKPTDERKAVGVTLNTTMLHSLNNYFDSTSTEKFDTVLKHALSHDPVISKHNLTPRIHRSMIFTEKPKTAVFVDGKKRFFEKATDLKL